eukprot:COSAG01_NODE_6011_length_3902_cov_10.567447_8_plen_57_part_00
MAAATGGGGGAENGHPPTPFFPTGDSEEARAKVSSSDAAMIRIGALPGFSLRRILV